MQTLILPGFSDKNKDWVNEVANNLDINGIIRPFHWAHWTDEGKKFDAQEKAELIVKHAKGDNLNIIAKSLGTLVACKLYLLIPDQIERMVLCGIPVKDLKYDEILTIKNTLKSNEEDFICFQNSKDPHGSYEKVKDFGKVRYFESNTHEYPYFSEFQDFLGN